MNNVITREERIIFQDIFNLNKKIAKLYNKLTNLEINQLIDTLEYKNIKKYISICQEVENELYQKLDCDKFPIYLDYLQKNLYDNISDYDVICSDFEDLILHKRIYNRISSMETSLIIEDIQKENDDTLDSQRIMLVNTIHEDFLNLFIFFLNDFINNPIFNKYKEDLIKAKYKVYFLNNQLEKMFLQNSTRDNIINCFSTADLLTIEQKELHHLVYIYINKYIKKYFPKLLEITDDMYKDDEKVRLSLLYQALIKSSLEISNLDFRIQEQDGGISNRISKNILENIKDNRGNYHLIKLRSERINI